MDALLRSAPARKGAQRFGRPLIKQALQETLAGLREELDGHRPPPEDAAILARALGSAARDFYGISRVINATGVILHTGLGRAPLPARAAVSAMAAARDYSDLELDRQTGGRGRRTARLESLLQALTSAEASLAVNNNAAALVLGVAALAGSKDVLVSRGELIEIGGEFRLPEILSASGARLLEVGTTNRTRPSDYRRALSRRTGLILKIHPSNYRVVGFTGTVPVPELAAVAAEARVPLLYDVGSGLLDRYAGVPRDEPAVTEALAEGAGLVAFSGDKLLGGPQAGLIAGRAELVERLRRHPLARAFRVDKMTVAALESVLRLYVTGRRLDLPVWSMLSMSQASLMSRARAVASCFDRATTRRGQATVGGGTLPGHSIPSAQVVLDFASANRAAARLRLGRPPVFCRVEDAALVFDLRTVPPEQDDRLIRAVRYALEQA